MKTKELIQKLQDLDPEGNLDCCIGNQDIFTIGIEPSYWDGCKQILIKDEDCEYYNIIGAKVSSRGFKLVIDSLSIQGAIWENPDLPIEYDEYTERHYKELYDSYRKDRKNYDEKRRKENESK